MNPPQQEQGQKNLAEIRKQITPECDEVDDQVKSNESDDLKQEGGNQEPKIDPDQEDESWGNLPNREVGECQTLQPIKDDQQNLKQKEQQINDTKEDQQNKKHKNTHKKQIYKLNKQEEQYKIYYLPVDSKYVFASFYLLRDQLKKALKQLGGFVHFNPYINCKQIKIYYKDEANKAQLIDKVQQFINNLQLIDMGKNQAQSGVQLSYKYMQHLKKHKITIFKDPTQNYKTISYYMCGMVPSKKVLLEKVSQIKKMNFIWFHLYNFQNTRSYRAILRKIFAQPLTHQFAKDKLKCNEVEVANVSKNYILSQNTRKNGDNKIMILLTSLIGKKVAIHQQIDKQLTAFIKSTYLVFVFTFQRSKQAHAHQYTPKFQNVIMFFILQRPPMFKTGYLYIIVERNNFEKVKQTIIDQIKNMKLVINGQRFFKNLLPEKPYFESSTNYKFYRYPKYTPYSWTLKMKTSDQFDWVSQLKS